MPDQQNTAGNAVKHVQLYTDGACSGNPGVGGWACLLMAGGRHKEMSGAEASTTNNRMEMQAVIEGLKVLKWPCKVDLYSDSAYVVNAFQLGWIKNWQKNNWRNSAGQAVANRELWEILLELNKRHTIRWHKVKGHSDNPYNNRCDELAVAAVKAFKEQKRGS